MNEFTKEELWLILRGMRKYYLEDDLIKLNDKLQELIDNHCDHDGEIGKDYPDVYDSNCRHEWDGKLLTRPYAGNLGLCMHCGVECYVAIKE